MFGSAKNEENRFIIAIKDYANITKSIKEGSISLPFGKEIYLKLLESQGAKAGNVKELGKFIKASKKEKGNVLHFWEGLIGEGYTLVNVEYVSKEPSIERLCSNDSIKYVCSV